MNNEVISAKQLWEAGNVENALAMLNDIIQKNNKNIAALITRARILQQEVMHSNAAEDSQQVLMLTENTYAVEELLYRGYAFIVLGIPSKAFQSFFVANKLQANNPDILTGLGHANYLLNIAEQAEEYLVKSAQLRPDNFENWYFLGRINFDKNQYSDALKFLSDAEKLQSHNVEGQYWKALCHYELKEYKKAKAALKFVLKKQPDHQGAKEYYPKILAAKGHYKNANKMFKEVSFESRPTSYEEWKNFFSSSIAAPTLEYAEQGAKFYKEAVELRKKNKLEESKKIFALAVSQFEKAIQHHLENFNNTDSVDRMYSNLGHCHFNLKNYQQAIKNYDEAIKLNPKLTSSYEYRSKSYLRLSQEKTGDEKVQLENKAKLDESIAQQLAANNKSSAAIMKK